MTSQTATAAGATAVICTVISQAKAVGTAKPGAAILADAITEHGPGAWTFHLFDVDGAWRVGVVADPSPHPPTGWYAGLRTQAGLPAR